MKRILLFLTALAICTTTFAQNYNVPPEWTVEVEPNPGFTQTSAGIWTIATELILANEVIIPIKVTVTNPSTTPIINSKLLFLMSSFGLEYDASLTTDFTILGNNASSDNIDLDPGESKVYWCYMKVTEEQCGQDPTFVVYWHSFDPLPYAQYAAYPSFMSFNTLQVTPQSIQPQCGQPNGSIDLNISGGIPPMTITWDNGATTEIIENLSFGSYSYTVQDAYGCEKTDTIYFDPTIEIKSHSVSATTCSVDNGQAYVDWVQGTPPFLIELLDQNWLVIDDATVAGSGPLYDYLFSGLPAGLYTFRLTDANNNCNFYRDMNNDIIWDEVLPSNNLDFTYQISDPTCYYNSNGSIEITSIINSPSYGIQYLWSTSDVSSQISQLSTGEYIVTVTDADGCEKVKVLNLTCPEQGTLTITPVHPDCNSYPGSIELDYSSTTWSYEVTGPSGTFTNSASGPVTVSNINAGTYTIDITDNACTYSYEQELSVLDIFDFSLQINECSPYNAGLLECNLVGGTLPYNSPLYEFYWEWNGMPYSYAQNNYMISDGTYCVTVTDGNSCTVSHCETYTTPNNLLNITLNALHPTCPDPENGELTVTASDGVAPYSYNWSNGGSTAGISYLESSIAYEVTVTDDYGCVETEEFLLNDYDHMYLNSEVTDTYCGTSNGSIDITVISGVAPFTYSWSHGPITEDVSGLGVGEYSVIVTDNTGCQVTEIFNLRGSLDLSWDVVGRGCDGDPSTPNPLQNGSIDLTVNNGVSPYSFSWSNSATTEDISGCEDGITYTVNVTDNAGCLGFAEIIMGSDQTIALDAGWNHISTYIDPFNNDIKEILKESDVLHLVEKVKKQDQDVSDFYLTTYDVPYFEIGEGYYIKMNEAGSIKMFGELLCPEDNEIALTMPTAPEEEWIGYLRKTEQDVTDVFSAFTSNIMVIKEDLGGLWWPLYGLNTLGNMKPGEGYNVALSSLPSVPFYYAANNNYVGTKNSVDNSLSSTYNKLKNTSNLNTSNTMVVGIPENAWENMPEYGDEIGLYSATGKLIGRSKFNGGHTGIIIYGDDEPALVEEAIRVGDSFRIYVWNSQNNQENEFVAQDWLIGDNHYVENGVSIVKSLHSENELDEAGAFEVSVFPNPILIETNIRLNIQSVTKVTIDLLNINGQLIESHLFDGDLEKGTYRFIYNFGHLNAGYYLIKITTDNTTYIEKVIIAK